MGRPSPSTKECSGAYLIGYTSILHTSCLHTYTSIQSMSFYKQDWTYHLNDRIGLRAIKNVPHVDAFRSSLRLSIRDEKREVNFEKESTAKKTKIHTNTQPSVQMASEILLKRACAHRAGGPRGSVLRTRRTPASVEEKLNCFERFTPRWIPRRQH